MFDNEYKEKNGQNADDNTEDIKTDKNIVSADESNKSEDAINKDKEQFNSFLNEYKDKLEEQKGILKKSDDEDKAAESSDMHISRENSTHSFEGDNDVSEEKDISEERPDINSDEFAMWFKEHPESSEETINENFSNKNDNHEKNDEPDNAEKSAVNFTMRDDDAYMRNSTGQDYGYAEPESKGTENHSYYEQDKKYYDSGSNNNNDFNPAGNQRRRNRHPVLKSALCGVICGAIIAAFVLGSFIVGRDIISAENGENTLTISTNAGNLASISQSDIDSGQDVTIDASDSGKEYTISQIAEQCGSSVVAITNKSVQEVLTMFGFFQQESEGSGSGVIIGMTDDELLITTNYHVIEGADELTVCFFDSEDAVYSAWVKGSDSNNDIAVLAVSIDAISEDVLNKISIATIGDSSSLKVGDSVVAIGNALGLGQTVTSGIVSAIDREVTIDNYTARLIQTDAAINPGNSGGALFNMKGELIGINSAKYASDEIEGMGFAIPTSTAQPIIEALSNMETKEKLTENYGVLSIYGTDVSTEATQMYGMPAGVYISETEEGGAAENAGLRAGDIITNIDGISVVSVEELRERLQYYPAGDTVEVTFQRNNGSGYEEMSTEAKLDNVSSQADSESNKEEQSSEDKNLDNYYSGDNSFQDIQDFFEQFGNY